VTPWFFHERRGERRLCIWGKGRIGVRVLVVLVVEKREKEIFTVESRDWEQRKGKTGRSIPDTRIRGLYPQRAGMGVDTIASIRVWGREDSR